MNILILDDCQLQLSALTRLFRAQGHSVVGTKSPTDAFWAVSTNWPDTLICDWDLGLGVVKGDKFIDSVKNIWSLKCILYTGKSFYTTGFHKPDAIVKKGDIESLQKAIEA